MSKRFVEEWCPVKGFEGTYEASDRGCVRRVLGSPGTRAGKVLKHLSKDGYQRVFLCANGKPRMFSVHRLVAEAFLGGPPEGWVCHHRNGDRADNRLENLEWTTRSRNTSIGCSGEGNGSARLSEEAVKVSRWFFSRGLRSAAFLARIHGVSHAAMHKAASGRSWRHLNA